MLDHIHNETVLEFLKEHSDNKGIKEFITGEQGSIEALNKTFGTTYKNYLDYLEDNIGDDASFTMDELKALLKPEQKTGKKN